MRFRRPKLSLNVAALVAALLFAQVVSSAHVDLDDTHPAGEACAICVVHAQLGSANVSALVVVDVDTQRPEAAELLSVPSARQGFDFRFARGPPRVS